MQHSHESHLIDAVFVCIMCCMCIDPVPFGMELRATPVFTLPHDMSKVVRRCPAHMRDFQVGGGKPTCQQHTCIIVFQASPFQRH